MEPRFLSLALGALVESGASPELAWPAVGKDLAGLLDQATAFASAAVKHAKDEHVDTAIESSGAAVAKKKPREGEAWKALPSRCLAAVACLTRSKKLRKRAGKDETLLEAAWPLSDVVSEVGYLLQALRIVDDETFLVLAPDARRGWRVTVDAMPSNAELYILLADALLGDGKPGSKARGPARLPGKRPDPKAVAAIHEGAHPPKSASSVKLPFHLVAWTAVEEGGSLPPADPHETDHWIWMEGIPADIPPGAGKERVVLLQDAPYPRSIPVAPSFDSLRPEVRIAGELSADEVDRAMLTLGKAAAKARPAKPKTDCGADDEERSGKAEDERSGKAEDESPGNAEGESSGKAEGESPGNAEGTLRQSRRQKLRQRRRRTLRQSRRRRPDAHRRRAERRGIETERVDLAAVGHHRGRLDGDETRVDTDEHRDGERGNRRELERQVLRRRERHDVDQDTLRRPLQGEVGKDERRSRAHRLGVQIDADAGGAKGTSDAAREPSVRRCRHRRRERDRAVAFERQHRTPHAERDPRAKRPRRRRHERGYEARDHAPVLRGVVEDCERPGERHARRLAVHVEAHEETVTLRRERDGRGVACDCRLHLHRARDERLREREVVPGDEVTRGRWLVRRHEHTTDLPIGEEAPHDELAREAEPLGSLGDRLFAWVARGELEDHVAQRRGVDGRVDPRLPPPALDRPQRFRDAHRHLRLARHPRESAWRHDVRVSDREPGEPGYGFEHRGHERLVCLAEPAREEAPVGDRVREAFKRQQHRLLRRLPPAPRL